MHRSIPIFFLLPLLLPAWLGPACVGAPKSVRRAESLVPSTLRMHECQRPEEFLRALPLAELESCLAGIEKEQELVYRLRRAPQPYLELQDPEKAPECVRQGMGRIPVPREITFQSIEGDRVGCYNASLNLKKDEILGAKVPFQGQFRLKIRLPLDDTPEDRASLVRLLSAWAITPVWREDGDSPRVEPVPTGLCRRCLSKDGFIPERDRALPHSSWPNELEELPEAGI